MIGWNGEEPMNLKKRRQAPELQALQTVDKSPISSERDWTFSMYKMKINVEIPIIKTANMI